MRRATEDGLREAVQERRKQLRLSQQELAVEIGVALRTYQRWEGGKDKGRPIERNLVKLARALDTTPMELETRALILQDPAATQSRDQAIQNVISDLRTDLADLRARVLRIENRIEDDGTT